MAQSSVIVIGSFAQSLVNFRGPLLAALVEQGYRVLGCAPGYEPDVVARLSGMGVEFHQISMDRTGVSPWADVLTMLQGITGLAQTNGRNALTWEQKFQLDVWYVDNRTPLLDIKSCY